MKKRIFSLFAVVMMLMPAMAQRTTDQLDRGLIALPSNNGGYLVSWRLLGHEYYDVTYNVYRDGQLIASGLEVSNFRDATGSKDNSYSVSAVVSGQEQEQCAPVKAWSSSYKQITLTHEGIRSTLVPNDACCADVDGDGELEILMKFDNLSEMQQSYPKEGPVVNGVTTREYSIFEVLKLDGTRLWWVNCGPNMGDFQNNEQNIVGYDWNCDGKAEVIMRLLEGSSIHMADGTTYVIGANGQNGTSWYNYRAATGGGTNWFMHDGKEFLVYCNGESGKIYDIIDYPLARLESNETNLEKAWGDGYGHRCSKFFFGAPYLDGRKPSIFLARGIYTQIKMCAFDPDPETHKLVKRWDWRQTEGGFWMWQGYHNFGIADVDEDGRDEIVYGSMVIDDNGKGLSTTGLGHGDAQHCSDFNPYTKGLEIYACNEDQPGNNYRDATTSKIYHRFESGSDDGRAMMGNFTDAFPGSIGCSAREGAISSVTYGAVAGMSNVGINTNFRIYWDGDLCSETFNYLNGKNTEGCIAKYGSWSPIYTCSGSMTNNDTKGTPCYQGDILGDWREEIIMRDANNNIRIYSTPMSTTYRIPTLWSDHQYRNAMVWQMCGYNQPPHLSYFLGKLEGMTMAPPPLTMTGRVEVTNGGQADASLNGKHAIVCEMNNTQITMAEAIQPSVMTFNVPSWVQGTAGTNYKDKSATIKYDYYTCDVTAGSLSGNARLVKQGDGILNLPATEFTHTGETKIWAGTLNFDGKMQQSDLWLNRFAKLNSNGGAFKTITALYASELNPGGTQIGEMTIDSLCLDFGSRLIIDLDGSQCDKLILRALTSVRKTNAPWTTAGPAYLQPVIEVRGDNQQAGDYVIAECKELNGSLTNFKVEGVVGFKSGLKYEDGKLILSLGSTRGAGSVVWTGSKGSNWDYAITENFTNSDGNEEIFVNGDLVEFNDNAKQFTVTINGDLSVDTMRFSNETHDYIINGTGSIVRGALVKEGAGKVTISNLNSYTGGNYLRGGVVEVAALANDIAATGALGGNVSSSLRFVFSNGAELRTSSAVSNGSSIRMETEEGGVINNAADFTQQKAIVGTILTKKGSGRLVTNASGASLNRLVIASGSVENKSGNAAKVVEFQGGTLTDGVATSTKYEVPVGKTGVWYTSNSCTYTNSIVGQGKLTIFSSAIKGSGWYATRTPLKLDFTNFEGTIIPRAVNADDKRFTLSTNKGSDKMTFDIPDGVIVQNEGMTFRMGKVTGKGVLGGSCTFTQNGQPGANTWQVGGEDNFSFPGIVESNANFVKMGSSVMTVTGAWTTIGSVTIKEGEMKISNAVSLGTGVLTVDAGAVLHPYSSTANKPISNSSVRINGTLLPNITNEGGTGIAYFNGQSVTVGNTGILNLGIRRASTSATSMSGCYLKNIGTLTINGTISLFFTKTYTPQVGDEIRLWQDVNKVAGNPKIEVAPLADGSKVELDASRLLTEGVLVVSGVTAIDQIASDRADDEAIFNLNGQRMDESKDLPAGIYIQNRKKIIIR